MRNKPYNDLKSYLLKTFGCRVYKITIDSRLTCPNRVNGNGCIYCNQRGSGTGLWDKGYDIKTQISFGIEGLKRRYKKIDAFIAYFQSYTNTYAALETLKANWDEIRNFPDIVSLSIGTRPDCIDDDRLALLNDYSKDYKIFLELGLQSINEDHLKWINRGHNVKDFEYAVGLAKKYPFNLVAHLIFGFPNQDIDEIKETALYISRLGIHGVKIHLLYVAKGSTLAEIYEKGGFTPVERQKYLDMVVTFLEHLSPDVVIHRLTGDAHKGELIAPLWAIDKSSILNEIERLLRENKSYQGKHNK